MLPQIVYGDPSSTLVAEIGGDAYSRRHFDDKFLGDKNRYSGPSALWWLLELEVLVLICL